MHKALISPEDVDDFIIPRAQKFTNRVQRSMVRDVLNDENLPVLEWRLLFSLARFGSCHLAYITQHTSIDPAHGSRAVAALERKRLIQRRDDPDNRRRKVISLTADGIETFNRIWPRAQAKIRTITEQLNSDDFKDVKRLFDLLNDAAEVLTENDIPRQGEADNATQETALVAQR